MRVGLERKDYKMEPLTIGLLGMGAGMAGNALGGYFGSKGAEESARIQAQGADKSRAMLERFYGEAKQAQQPYSDQGLKGLNQYSENALNGGFQTAVPTYNAPQFNLGADAGYNFRMQQGNNAINNRAGASGGSLGGGVLKELARYNQGLASDETGNAYNRFMTDRNFGYNQMGDEYNRNVQQQGIKANGLQNLMGVGQQASTNMSNLASGMGSQLGDLEIQKANAQASGAGAGYNALGQFFGGLGNSAQSLTSLYGMGAFGGGAGGMPSSSGAGMLARPSSTPVGNYVQPNYSGYSGGFTPTPQQLIPPMSWQR